MTEWRLGRGWKSPELLKRLERLRGLPLNFDAYQDRMTPDFGWNRYHSMAIIAREPGGAPLRQGPFRRGKVAMANYQFSDPAVVVGHFDAASRLLGRRMLLEIRAVSVLHYLAGVVVGAVRDEENDGQHTFGFRYDTLEGHIERGSAWFLLIKDLRSGLIRFEIEAAWLPGDFPNWWSRAGFRFLAPHYQRRWHHEAHRRLFRIARGASATPLGPDELGLTHAGPEVTFRRTRRHLNEREGQWNEKETLKFSLRPPRSAA